jgi:hypothetical protein
MIFKKKNEAFATSFPMTLMTVEKKTASSDANIFRKDVG